jgi:hypothetical protein
MAAFVENGEFEVGVGNIAGLCEHFFEAAHGGFGAEDHSVSLSGEMNDVRAVAGGGEEAIDEFFGAGDLEAGAEGAAGVDERDEILGMTFGGGFEEGEGFVETIRLPECAGLL